MTKTHRTSLLLETRQPEPAKKSDWRNPYEEGKNLPSSIEEDVVGESLYPEYNEVQLRRISRLKYQSKFDVRNPNKYYRMEVAE